MCYHIYEKKQDWTCHSCDFPKRAGGEDFGVNTDRVYATTFAINAALCGVAGALVAMTFTIHPYIELQHTVRSFMIVSVAGVGNLLGVIASAFGLGIAEELSDYVLGAEFRLAFVFSLLVAILVFRNWQLMRKRLYLK